MANFVMSEQAEAAGNLMEGAFAGDKRDKAKFFEMLSTGDISPTLLQAPLTARVVSEYEGIKDTIGGAAVRETVDDFTLQEIFRIAFDDDSQVLEKNVGKTRVTGTLPRVGELGEYQSFGFSSTNDSHRAYKSGIKFGLSWESVINGRNLSLLERATKQMARMARNTELSEVFGQYVTASGMNTANLSAAGDITNLISGNPALSMASLKTGLALAATHKVNGERYPISGAFTLVVSPSLEIAAREIIAVTEITTQTGSGSGAVIAKSGNPLAGKLNLQVAPTLTRINASADNYWFLVPDLSQTEGYRPELWAVRGEETPKFFVKSTTLQSPNEGDFDHDAYETKLRATATGVNTGMLGVVGSTGAGV